MNEESLTHSHSRTFSIIAGILLVVLGLFVLGSQLFATAISVYALGWILLISGAALFVYSFFSGSVGRFFGYVIFGVLSFIIGIILITNPLVSAVSITFLIAIMLLVNGVTVMIASAIYHEKRWGWAFFSGIVSFLLGLAILGSWPVSGLWVIGLFLGIQLIVSGFMLMTSSPSEQIARSAYNAPYVSGAKGGRAEQDDEDSTKY